MNTRYLTTGNFLRSAIIDGTVIKTVLNFWTIEQALVEWDPFRMPEMHGGTRNVRAKDVSFFLRMHGF